MTVPRHPRRIRLAGNDQLAAWVDQGSEEALRELRRRLVNRARRRGYLPPRRPMTEWAHPWPSPTPPADAA